MGIIYEPEDGSKWWIEAREKSVIIHDCGKRELELDNEEFPEFLRAFERARTLIRVRKSGGTKLYAKNIKTIDESDIF